MCFDRETINVGIDILITDGVGVSAGGAVLKLGVLSGLERGGDLVTVDPGGFWFVFYACVEKGAFLIEVACIKFSGGEPCKAAWIAEGGVITGDVVLI